MMAACVVLVLPSMTACELEEILDDWVKVGSFSRTVVEKSGQSSNQELDELLGHFSIGLNEKLNVHLANPLRRQLWQGIKDHGYPSSHLCSPLSIDPPTLTWWMGKSFSQPRRDFISSLSQSYHGQAITAGTTLPWACYNKGDCHLCTAPSLRSTQNTLCAACQYWQPFPTVSQQPPH